MIYKTAREGFSAWVIGKLHPNAPELSEARASGATPNDTVVCVMHPDGRHIKSIDFLKPDLSLVGTGPYLVPWDEGLTPGSVIAVQGVEGAPEAYLQLVRLTMNPQGEPRAITRTATGVEQEWRLFRPLNGVEKNDHQNR